MVHNEHFQFSAALIIEKLRKNKNTGSGLNGALVNISSKVKTFKQFLFKNENRTFLCAKDIGCNSSKLY